MLKTGVSLDLRGRGQQNFQGPYSQSPVSLYPNPVALVP